MSRKICWVYGNHWNFGITVSDTLNMLNKASLELGLKSSIEKELVLGAHNILLENFTDEYKVHLLNFKNKGGKFSIIATELLNNNSFNNFGNNTKDTTQYSDLKYWSRRFDNFLRLEKYATSIFHLNPTQANLYSTLLNRKVEFLPHGYVNGFTSVQHRALKDKDIDILFTGSATPYRKKILDQLKTKCNLFTTDVLTANFHRDDLVSRTKISLNIRQNENWNVFSNSRAHYHVSNQSFLLTEPCLDSCSMIDYVEISQSTIVEDALILLENNTWYEKAQQSEYRFKKESSLIVIANHIFLNL